MGYTPIIGGYGYLESKIGYIDLAKFYFVHI